MRALRAAREKKSIVEGGKWQTGKMPRTAFPLSKSHSYALGSSWRWRILDLTAGPKRFKLLVAYEKAKAQYRAWLGMEVGTDQALLARLEYHPSHRGWHCHLKTGEMSDVACGVIRESGRRERVKICRSDDDVSVTDSDALSIACRAFNVDADLGGLFK